MPFWEQSRLDLDLRYDANESFSLVSAGGAVLMDQAVVIVGALVVIVGVVGAVPHLPSLVRKKAGSQIRSMCEDGAVSPVSRFFKISFPLVCLASSEYILKYQ